MKRHFWLTFFLTSVFSLSSRPVYAEKLLTNLDFNGSVSLNWRSIGPQKPGYEQQIQHQISLADTYFGLTGSINNKIPFVLEFQIPTISQGKPILYQLIGTPALVGWPPGARTGEISGSIRLSQCHISAGAILIHDQAASLCFSR